jgi:hypothetical protein
MACSVSLASLELLSRFSSEGGLFTSGSIATLKIYWVKLDMNSKELSIIPKKSSNRKVASLMNSIDNSEKQEPF